MKVLVYVVFMVGLLMECAKTEETEKPTVQELKEAAVKSKDDIVCMKPDCACSYKSKSCCCGNTDLQTLREEVIETLTNISHRINQLSDEIQELTGPVNVAFTVYLGTEGRCLGPFERNMPIAYDDIRFNEGSGYNSVMGLFTAPVSGVYTFSLSVYSRSGHMFHKVQLMRNGRQQVATRENNRQDQEDSSSHQVLLSLQQGDQVYAELVHNRTLCGNVRGRNSFSGHLVYPLPASAF